MAKGVFTLRLILAWGENKATARRGRPDGRAVFSDGKGVRRYELQTAGRDSRDVFHMAVSYFEHKVKSYTTNTFLVGALTQVCGMLL